MFSAPSRFDHVHRLSDIELVNQMELDIQLYSASFFKHVIFDVCLVDGLDEAANSRGWLGYTPPPPPSTVNLLLPNSHHLSGDSYKWVAHDCQLNNVGPGGTVGPNWLRVAASVKDRSADRIQEEDEATGCSNVQQQRTGEEVRQRLFFFFFCPPPGWVPDPTQDHSATTTTRSTFRDPWLERDSRPSLHQRQRGVPQKTHPQNEGHSLRSWSRQQRERERERRRRRR